MDVRILVIDDQESHAKATAESLERAGYKCVTSTSAREGLKLLESSAIDLVVTDLVMPDMDGVAFIRQAKKTLPDVEVIVMTAYDNEDAVIDATKAGAADWMKKPLDIRRVRIVVERALDKQRLARENVDLHRQLDERYSFNEILGNTPAMMRVLDTVKQVAPTTATVLIQGETGTGKELIAKAIHRNSPRRAHKFLAVNCAALPEGLLESELFGHEKGAFTGAIAQRPGKFEYANRGTLLLDEIGDIALTMQAKLLRAVETREVVHVGSNDPIKVDVRLIAATNRDLAQMMKEGKFREDLYYRLRVVLIQLPPLRERFADFPLLVDSFLKEHARNNQKKISGITREALDILMRYSWPGNVRELRGILETMVVLARGEKLDVADIPPYVTPADPDRAPLPALSGISLEQAEKALIQKTLEDVKGNREKAAAILGIGERTLYRKLKLYGLSAAGKEGGE